MSGRPRSRLRPPWSEWQSSPLSPFRHDLREPGSSQHAASLFYLSDRSEAGLSLPRRTQYSTTLTELSPSAVLPGTREAFDVDESDSEDSKAAVRDDIDPSKSASHEGKDPRVDYAQAPDRDKQHESHQGPSTGEPFEPDVGVSSAGSATGPFQSSDKDEEGQSSVSASEEGPSPPTPAGAVSQHETHHWASRMRLGHLLRPEFPPISEVLESSGSLHPHGASTSAHPTERELGEERERRPLPSSRSSGDSSTSSNQLAGQLSSLPRDVLFSDTPKTIAEFGNSSNLGQSLLISPTQPIAAGLSPRLETKSLAASLPQHNILAGSKRPASEMSNDEEPSASHHEQTDKTEMTSNRHTHRATATATEDCTWLSDSLERAKCLIPPIINQQELYKIYSMLRQLVRLFAAEFSVVDPQDFIETLSWSHLPPSQTQSIAIICRLRGDISPQQGPKKNLLIPFRYKFNFFLACVNLSPRLRFLRIFDPEMTLAFDNHHKELFYGNWAPGLCVMQFVQTLFPDEPEVQKAWTTTREATAYAAEPVDDAGLVVGCYYEASGWRHPLQNVLPFFFEALHLVSWIEPPNNIVYDLSFAKRLLAAFEGSPARATIMEQLRQVCRSSMSTRLGNKVQHARRTAFKMVEMDYDCLYQRALTQRRDANVYIQGQVRAN